MERSIRNIRRVSLILMVVVSCTILGWLIWLVYHVWPFVFTDRIYDVGVTGEGVTITMIQRVVYGLIWVAAIALGLAAGGFAVKVLHLFSTGSYFTFATMRALKRMGFCLTAAMAFDFFMPTLVRVTLSWNNPAGIVTPDFWFEPADVFLGLAGLAFALIGWVFGVAREIYEENQEFV